MRFEGDIKDIVTIEKYIKTFTRHTVLKALPAEPAPCKKGIEASVHTRIYRIILSPYNFDVCLRFNERDGTGRYDMKDVNSQILFIKYPKIPDMLSRMDKMFISRRNGDGDYKVKEIILIKE